VLRWGPISTLCRAGKRSAPDRSVPGEEVHWELTPEEKERLSALTLRRAGGQLSVARDGLIGLCGVFGCGFVVLLISFVGLASTPGMRPSDAMRIAGDAPGTLSGHAGALAGDVLLAVDGSAVADWGAVSPLIFRSEASAPVRSRVLRGVSELEVSYERPQKGEVL
jgi:hypothetical protein